MLNDDRSIASSPTDGNAQMTRQKTPASSLDEEAQTSKEKFTLEFQM
jgi:hypothetical protein